MKIEAETLRRQSVEELEKTVAEVKARLALLRQKKNSGNVEQDEIRIAKKNLARVLAIRQERLLMDLVEKYKKTPVNKLPKELRPRLNKAKRQALTKAQLKRKTRRQRMKLAKFPRVIFAYNE